MEIGFSYWLKMRRIGDTLLLHSKKRGCRNWEIGKGFSLNIEKVLFGIEKKQTKPKSGGAGGPPHCGTSRHAKSA